MPFHVHLRSLSLPLLLLLAAVLPFSSACRTSPNQEFRFALVSQELSVEQTRFTFAILDRANMPVEDAEVSIDFLAPGDANATIQAEAEYRTIDLNAPPRADPEWYNPEVEVRGIYAIDELPIDRPGEWRLRVFVAPPNGESKREVRVTVDVLAESSTPRIGERVPRIDNATSEDVGELSSISTHPDPIPAMYRTSVADALAEGRPFLAIFATPAFCQSRICGPVLETAIKLLPVYEADLEFIHIEPYDLRLIREEGKLEPSREARTWGLPSEPWVFLVGAEGRLMAKFEGIVTYEELEKTIESMLGRG